MKFVFHIPLYKYKNSQLIRLEIDDLIDDLTEKFEDNGIISFYMQIVKGYYKKRKYDSLLITVFHLNDEIASIFVDWFRKNNGVLMQEALAYEKDNDLIVIEL